LKKKVLIIGADSNIGKVLFRYLKKKNFLVIGTSRRQKSKFIRLDLLSKLNKWPTINNLDSIICCAAITKIEDCKKNLKISKKTNIEGIKNIIKKYKKDEKTQIIFLSSSHVFYGKKKFIKKNEIRYPKNVYGKQKKICEDIIIKNNGLILRVSKLVESLNALISKWSANLNNYKHISPFENLNVSLFSINNLQKLIFYAIKNDKRGIIHLSATNEINYLKIGRILADFLNRPQSLVIPTKASKKISSNRGSHATLKLSRSIKKIISIDNSEKVLKEFLK
jgi:dTDP-4-dehydrorhamnose reductase